MRVSDDAAMGALCELSALLAATRRVSGLLDAAVLAQRAATEARQLAGTELSAVALAEDPAVLVMRGTAGVHTPAISQLRIPRGTGLGGRILLERRPISVSDYAHDPAITRDLAGVVADAEGIRALTGAPIEYHDRVLGILYGGLRRVDPIDGRGQTALVEFATSLGPLIGAARDAEQVRQLSLQEQRQRIALELHDTVGQLLFGIGVAARRANAACSNSDSAGAADLLLELSAIEAGVSRAASELRGALRELTPTTPDKALAATIRMDASAFTARSGAPVHFVVVGEPVDLTAAVQAVLLSVVREGLHNVEKYARASSVILTLLYGAGSVGIVIQDDGVGLPPEFVLEALPSGGRRLGLASLLQRTEQLGGSFVVITNEDGGVTLRANVPLVTAGG